MKVSASCGGPVAATATTLFKEPTGTLELPVAEIDDAEGMSLGFRSEFFSLADEDGNGVSASSGAGFGVPAVIMDYRRGDDRRSIRLNVIEMAIAWVRTFEPKEADRMLAAARKSYGLSDAA
jgi:hypothetical protein